jgi:hypothetical protein
MVYAIGGRPVRAMIVVLQPPAERHILMKNKCKKPPGKT